MTVEPFLIAGMVAAIRRLIVISAEPENLLGTPGCALKVLLTAGG